MFSLVSAASRNLLLTPSRPDDWSADTTLASTTLDVQTHNDHPNKNIKTHRFPHSLRLDEGCIVYSFCDLYSIPEDNPVCEYKQVVKGRERRRKNHAMTSEQFHTLMHKALLEERLEKETTNKRGEDSKNKEKSSDNPK